MFYTFRQNNSGGVFDEDAERGISVNVIVEANSPEEATRRAEAIGLYWNGCDTGQDCSCCGDRWYNPYASDWGKPDEGDEVPSIYGTPITEPESMGLGLRWASPEGYVHYLDGRVEAFDRPWAEEVSS